MASTSPAFADALKSWRARHAQTPQETIAIRVEASTSNERVANVFEGARDAGFSEALLSISPLTDSPVRVALPRPPRSGPEDNPLGDHDVAIVVESRGTHWIQVHASGLRSNTKALASSEALVLAIERERAISSRLETRIYFDNDGDFASLYRVATAAAPGRVRMQPLGPPPHYPSGYTKGRLAPAIIQAIVRMNFARVRACYDAGLGRNSNLAGRISVRFVIEKTGAVTGTRTGDGTVLEDAAVLRCVVDVFEEFEFPPPEAGTVTVVYPFTLSPADEAEVPAAKTPR